MSDHFDEQAATWDEDPVKTERAATVAREILQRVPVDGESRVLDFGSGTGLLGFHFVSRAASVTFADPSQGMLDQVKAKLAARDGAEGTTVRFDPSAPALPGRYHAIVSLMTLHHVTSPAETLAFLAEHLEAGGWLAFCDLDSEDGSFHDDPSLKVHHGFDRGELTAILEGLGMEEVGFATPWVMRKETPDGEREYPLFLLTARRPDGPPPPSEVLRGE